MAAELTAQPHDPKDERPPAGWTEFIHTGAVHPFWHWPVIHASASAFGGTTLVASIRDAGRIIGVATAKVRGPRHGWPGPRIIDVKCDGSSALPGIALANTLPGPLASDGRGEAALFAAAVHAWERLLRTIYRTTVPVVCYRQIYADALPLLLRRTSVSYAGGLVAVWRNRTGSFAGYLAGLSKSRRGDLRRLLRRFDEAPELNIDLGPVPQDTAPHRLDSDHTQTRRPVPDGLDLPAMAGLAAQTARRNTTHWLMRLRTMPVSVQHALITGPDTWLLRYTDPAGLLGWGLTYDHPTMPVAGLWGCRDPHTTGRSGIWYDQLARTVRHTIEAGRDGLIEGKGRVDLKVACGFDTVPQWTVLRRLDVPD